MSNSRSRQFLETLPTYANTLAPSLGPWRLMSGSGLFALMSREGFAITVPKATVDVMDSPHYDQRDRMASKKMIDDLARALLKLSWQKSGLWGKGLTIKRFVVWKALTAQFNGFSQPKPVAKLPIDLIVLWTVQKNGRLYQLDIVEAIKPFYPKASLGKVSKVLERLREEGLVDSRDGDCLGGGICRQLYQVTEAGQAKIDRLLEAPSL